MTNVLPGSKVLSSLQALRLFRSGAALELPFLGRLGSIGMRADSGVSRPLGLLDAVNPERHVINGLVAALGDGPDGWLDQFLAQLRGGSGRNLDLGALHLWSRTGAHAGLGELEFDLELFAGLLVKI